MQILTQHILRDDQPVRKRETEPVALKNDR